MTQTPNKMNKAECRYILAVCECCRGILYGKGFLTERENERIFNRILKYQDENEIEITDAQMFSVGISYDDNAKDTDPE